MSEYTSSPSRPASPVALLPDLPTARPSAYRFNWDPTSRRPGPGSVSEATEGRGDYFSSTPKVDIYGASASTTTLPLSAVPSQWSSAKHGFHAISTVVNNPHKKSAPPKAHAAVPPAPRVELPRVRRKDFNSYLSAIEPEWRAFQRNAEFGRAGSAQLQEPSMADAYNETDSQHTPLPPKLLPPLSSVPEIFFKPAFDLGEPRTFDAVAEVPSASTSSSSHPSTSRPTSPMTPHDPSTLAHSLPLLEKLSHHADTIEQHLVREIARRATPFFAALSNLQDLQEESARCLKRVQDLRAQLGHVSEHGARRGLRGVQREIRLAHLREVQSVVRAVSGVIETVGIVRGLVDDGQWGEALDGVDDLRAMWDGPSAPGPASPLAPSPQASQLPSVAEEEPSDDEEEEVESGLEVGVELEIPLSRLKAFAALPSQLQTLTQEITSSLISDLVATLKIDLLERINRADSSSSDQADVRDRLRPLIQGLVRTRYLKESIAEWRGVVLGEVQGIVQQHIPAFNPGEDPQKESGASSWISSLRSMTHQEFQALLRSTLQSFLNCIEGLQTLGDNITEVTKGTRPPPLSLELTEMQDSLFDTLSSTVESANVLMSKVLSTRAEQHAKLDLREFVEVFNECWSFVVRCEVTCKRMIVGLRGVVVSQAKSFLQAFHQSRINQSAKLVEDEQWGQAEVPPSLQQVVNLVLDAAVHDPREFVLKVETAVAAPTSPLPAPTSLRPPSPPLQPPRSDSRPSSPRASSPRASSRTNGASSTQPRKHLRIEERSYFTVSATQDTLLLLADYVKVIVNLSLLTTDTMSRIVEFLKAFNSRTCQVVLGAGAMRSAGLKNITAKHLALASQSLSIVIAIIPYIRETFRRHLSPKQAVMLVEFDKLKRDYQEHQNEIHAKLIAIMGDRLAAHIKSLNAINWDAPPAKPGVNDYMELLVKETVTLHKVLSRYLSSAVVEYVMSEVFAAINHRLSEEYTKIELPTPDAKERLLTDARYLHEKFSALKTPGIPTAVLETLVADKRFGATPSSPRPVAPTNAPSSPLPLPPTNVPLGSPRATAPMLTKRPSLFSNDRLKGMLSRSATLPPTPTTTSVPTPAQEKQVGYKQASVLLSPMPLPVEKHRDLPKSPVSVPIHATPSPTPQVDEERQEPTDEASNGDPSVLAGPAPDTGTDNVEQRHSDVVERAPPTPAKDTAVSNRTMVPEPVSEGTGVVAST